MTEISHEEAFSELGAAALDAIPSEVADAVRAHAAVCPECGPELAAMEETVATIGHLAPPAQMNRGRSAGIRSRLIAGARAMRESRSAPAPGPPDLARGLASLKGQGQRITPGAQRKVTGETRKVSAPTPTGDRVGLVPFRWRVDWYAAAATFALVAVGAQLYRTSSERNEMRARLAAVSVAAPQTDSLMSVLGQKDSMIAAMTGPDVKVVPLMNQRAKQPAGRMMWNRVTNDWIMVAYDLEPLKPGMTYQLWLVTDRAKISAGTFRPDANGKTMMHARYRMARDALRAIAITEEPEGGMPAPTGPMVVAGAA